MKIFPLLALICLLATGCANPAKQPATETGNGQGGADVAGSFPGSVGAGNKTATGSTAGVRSNTTGQ